MTIRRWSRSCWGSAAKFALQQVGDRGLAGGGLFGERGRLVDVLVIEAGHPLGLAVLEDLEVEGLEIFDQRAGLSRSRTTTLVSTILALTVSL